MFGVSRRKSLRRKGRIFGLSLHQGFFVIWWVGRSESRDSQRLQHAPRVGAASADSAPLRLIVQAQAHQPKRAKRLHRPLGREINPRLLKPAVQQSLHQQS
jgi:hypothetical protein